MESYCGESSVENKDLYNDTSKDNILQTELFLYHSDLDSLSNLCTVCNNLTKLIIIGHPKLKSLNGIENIPFLKELWVSECSIQETSAIVKSSHLEKVYLYSNQLKQIPDLSLCKKSLQILWLSGNQITSIKNLDQLEELQELNLGNNKIYEIGTNLQKNENLTTLNLAGNPLYYIKDLCHLASLNSLRDLRIVDLLYGECPISQLCNYRSYIIQHLAKLQMLDGFSIEKHERISVQEFYNNKIMYYRNSYQTHLSQYYTQIARKEMENREVIAQFRENLYIYNLKEIEAQINPDQNTVSKDEHIKTKIGAPPSQNEKMVQTLIRMETFSQGKYKVLQLKECQLNYELQTAGNVTFSEVTEDCQFMEPCQTLMDHFICTHMKRKYGIKGTVIVKVIHVKNKGLDLISEYVKFLNKNKRKKYMFMLLYKRFSAKNKISWPFDICSKGFIGTEGMVKVTDCLGFLDLPSITHTTAAARNKFTCLQPEYNNEHHICIIVKLLPQALLERIKKSCANQESSKTRQRTLYGYGKSCGIYLVSNPKAVNPTFMLEYQYIIENPLETFKKKMGWTCDVHAAQLSPVSLPLYPVLDEVSLIQILPSDSVYDSLVELTLSGCGIKTIGILPQSPNVITVNISYNNITNISGFSAFPNLKYLDMSFNSIFSLEGIETLPHLNTFIVSWNQLNKFLQCIKNLQRCSPQLKNLDLSHNPFDITEENHILLLTKQLFPVLEFLNGIQLADSILKQQTVLDLKTVRKGKVIPSSFKTSSIDLKWNVEICNELWKEEESKGCEENEDCLQWISLPGQHITSVTSPECMSKTLWADFSNNHLDNVRFLENGQMLEELSLSHNVIQELDSSLHAMRNLVKLDLSDNYITSLKVFCGSHYPALKVLNVSKNCLTSLMGIESCEALVELYASHNSLTQVDDLHGLQNCKDLQIIDLCENPVGCNTQLPKFVLFHLPELKVLNGSYIHSMNLAGINEITDGHLSEELLLQYHAMVELRNMSELTLTQCNIKTISFSEDLLPNLRSLNLQHNKISSLWGFHLLPSLTSLCLSFNQVREINQKNTAGYENNCKIFFPELQTLFLDNNNIISLKALHLSKLPKLQTLFVQDNEMINMKGLQGALTLRALIADRNKLECASSEDISNLPNLRELYMEGNKVEHLYFIKQFKGLQRLLIGQNMISDPEELRHLTVLRNLRETGLLGNPMCCKINYHQAINRYLPNVTLIDGINAEINE